jgi:hypothetical protein
LRYVSSIDPGYIVDQPSLFGQSTPVGFGVKSFYVKLIPSVTANKIICDNHYSKSICKGSKHHFGVFLEDEMLGVIQWGSAINSMSGSNIVPGLQFDEWRELNRMWVDDRAPKNTESRAISYTIKTLKKIYPRLKMVQSFADERCGGLGVVYQACSFGFYGEHESVFWELDGKWFHNIAMTTVDKGKQWHNARVLQSNAARAVKHSFRQFRYLRFFSKNAENACRLKKLPYPKHGRELTGSDSPLRDG